MTYLHKNIQHPWLDLIENGLKKYEGRIRWKDWIDVKIGDIIVFSDGIKDVNVIITDLRFYKDFGTAYDDLKEKLVPIVGITRDEVIKIYENIYDPSSIKEFGVVAVGVELISK